MAILTQGTQVFALVPSETPGKMEVLEVECATSFSPGGNPADQIDVTCLSDKDRAFLRGLRTPGTASLSLNADPRNASHLRLHELSESDEENILWAIGWSDGADAPTLTQDEDDWELPATRTWFTFEGYVADFPFDFTGNTVVTSEVQIQRSGGSAWIAKES